MSTENTVVTPKLSSTPTSNEMPLSTSSPKPIGQPASLKRFERGSVNSLNDLFLPDSGNLADGGSDSSRASPSTVVLSEKVQRIASLIHAEFEAMIEAYGFSVAERLMPQVVGLLENLDDLYKDQAAYHAEVGQLREEHTHMMSQLDHEKSQRKQCEHRLMQAEDAFEDEKKALLQKIEVGSVSFRQLELKFQNVRDHASRLETKEAEWRKECSHLHDRVNELLRSNIDLANQVKSAGQVGGDSPSSRRAMIHFDIVTKETLNLQQGGDSNPSLRPLTQSLYDTTSGAGYGFDEMPSADHEGGIPLDDELPDESFVSTAAASHLPSEADAGEFDEFFGMRREIENIIKENMELVETKNALNVVKDDLLAKLDVLSCENISLHESVAHLTNSRDSVQAELKCSDQMLGDCRAELAELKESLSRKAQEPSQRKRFTRAELQRVLTERNQYKERLLELQDTVRYTEIIRACQKGHDPELLSGLGTPAWFKSTSSRHDTTQPESSTATTVLGNRPLQNLQKLLESRRGN